MFLSASEKTATVFIPISLAVRITRIAISPRLATSIFCIYFFDLSTAIASAKAIATAVA
jgi:hypothetical protein